VACPTNDAAHQELGIPQKTEGIAIYLSPQQYSLSVVPDVAAPIGSPDRRRQSVGYKVGTKIAGESVGILKARRETGDPRPALIQPNRNATPAQRLSSRDSGYSRTHDSHW
jgi:hypothetical protein